jgi:hypothetical protein
MTERAPFTLLQDLSTALAGLVASTSRSVTASTPFLVGVEDSTRVFGLEHAADIPQMRHGLLTIALPPPP